MTRIQRQLPRLAVAALALLLAACATPGDEERVEDERAAAEAERQQAESEADAERGTEVWAMEGRDALEGEELQQALDDPDSPIARRTVYFDFDSSEIRTEDMEVLEAHGGFLADHPAQRITIEGHTDERGSREYNLALGERRATAVRRVLLLNGAAEEQLQVVSYGEESPAVSGSSEEAYSENRRAELIYQR